MARESSLRGQQASQAMEDSSVTKEGNLPWYVCTEKKSNIGLRMGGHDAKGSLVRKHREKATPLLPFVPSWTQVVSYIPQPPSGGKMSCSKSWASAKEKWLCGVREADSHKCKS